MATRFGQIFWGMVLVLLDVSINGFDLLPDVIGYALVAIGAGGLVNVSPLFATARWTSWVLALISLVAYALPRDAAFVVSLVATVINCLMMWTLLGGIIDLANSAGRTDLAERAANRRLAYVLLTVVVMVIGLIGQGSRDLAMPMAMLALISMLVLLVMILHLLWRVRQELVPPTA